MRAAAVTAIVAGLISAAWPPAGGATGREALDRRAAANIDRGLRAYGSPLTGYGAAFVDAGRRYRVAPELVASIAGVESTFGRAACGFNAWGIASCRGVRFTSWTAGIEYVSRLLRQQYLDAGRVSLTAIGRAYCPPCGPKWASDVSWLMRHVFQVEASAVGA